MQFKSLVAATLLSLVTFASAAATPAVVSSSAVAPVSTPAAAPPKTFIAPQIEYAFSVFINLKPTLLADGPFGERVNVGYNNGTITNKDGKTIGTVVPGVGSENAIVDEEGVVHLNARVTATMASDSAPVYITLEGAGVTVGDNLLCQGYMVMEGNTTAFPTMNKNTYVFTLRRSVPLDTSQIDVFQASYPGVN